MGNQCCGNKLNLLNHELRCSDEDTSQKFVNIISVGSKNEVEEIDCGLEIKESCRKSSRIEEQIKIISDDNNNFAHQYLTPHEDQKVVMQSIKCPSSFDVFDEIVKPRSNSFLKAFAKDPSASLSQVTDLKNKTNQQRKSINILPINNEEEKRSTQQNRTPSLLKDSIPDSLSRSRYKEMSYLSGSNISDQKSPLELEKSLQSKSMKIGIDQFINLKDGSIQKYYEIGQLIGSGAFGKVQKVNHKQTGILRAMKIVKKNSLIKEDQQRLFTEMQVLKVIDHPNIVRLYELYQDDTHYYLVTEYLSGGQLFERIKNLKQFTEKKAAEYISQILSAVLYCHDQNIVHRDLKPENILFANSNPDSQLKVIDFGTSRHFQNNIKMTKKLGTPYYVAPEVLKQSYNEKCDLWSCGIVLYIMLCGHPPFKGKTELEVLNNVSRGRYSLEDQEWQKVSLPAKDLVQKLLTYDPVKRISAKEALSHPWIQKHDNVSVVSKKALQNLCEFQAQSDLKKALMTFMVNTMSSPAEIEDLQKTFTSLDKNKDGHLSKEELIIGYTQLLKNEKQAQEEVEKILTLVDLNQSGKVDFTEFLTAAMNHERLLSQTKIQAAFKLLDLDGDGYIQRTELEQLMGKLDQQIWMQMLQDSDKNSDGKISYAEFKNLLIQKK